MEKRSSPASVAELVALWPAELMESCLVQSPDEDARNVRGVNTAQTRLLMTHTRSFIESRSIQTTHETAHVKERSGGTKVSAVLPCSVARSRFFVTLNHNQ